MTKILKYTPYVVRVPESEPCKRCAKKDKRIAELMERIAELESK